MQKIYLSSGEDHLLREHGFHLTDPHGMLISLPEDDDRFTFITAYILMKHGIWCALYDDPKDTNDDGDFSSKWPLSFRQGKFMYLSDFTKEVDASYDLSINECTHSLWKISKSQDRSFVSVQESFV